LPAALKASLERLTHGLSRKEISERAAMISANYRNGGSSIVIRDASDALAYALARMPATFAAVEACLEEVFHAQPDHAPTSLLDIGAGPGTATWAAAAAFPSLADFVQLDINITLKTLALDLMQDCERFSAVRYETGSIHAALATASEADLVIASYVLGEIPDREHAAAADAFWAKTRGTLLVVEPGTPAGYDRIMALRSRLIATGAHMLAPCPHDKACPLSAPDWCHFSKRLARSRDHMQVKGAELPFEDERFAYVALARTPIHKPPAARVLAQPAISKIGVFTKLCLAEGAAVVATTPRRDKQNYAEAKRRRWGDAVKTAE
jgi:ribosomal protein RSM22 (predicted rRNA methylase)